MSTRAALCLTALLAAPACAGAELTEADFLAELPTVLTASRLAQPIMDAPTAIAVIDRDMIEASGFHLLADLFRLVPGFYVGHKTGSLQNVNHGLSEEFSRRMQVLVDGRSVYLPSFGGVRWDALPLAIDDIERIEVVRGPNAASYGANAFTGIINIITVHAGEVEGELLHLMAGAREGRSALYRWAGGEARLHRLSFGYRKDSGFELQNDDTRAPMLNFRGDYDLGPGRDLSVQAGYVGGERGVQPNPVNLAHDQEVTSHFQQADYRAGLDGGRELLVKAYHNYQQDRELVPTIPAVPGPYRRDLSAERWHLEFQVNEDAGEALRASWGGFLRRDTVQSLHYFGRPDALDTDTQGLFGHLEWRPAPAWLVNAGAMWERHDIAGSTVSPRATLHWQPGAQHGLRAGVSRAYRNPVQFEADADWFKYPTLRFLSGGNLEPEAITSQELGYRGNWPAMGLSVDLRLYRDRMSRLIYFFPAGKSGGVTRVDFANLGEQVHLRGFEGQVQWRFAPHGRLVVNQSVARASGGLVRDASGKLLFDHAAATPPRQTGLHLMHQLPGAWEASINYYWIDDFTPLGTGALPSQERLDARLAKSIRLGHTNARITLVMQNLGNPYHEYENNKSGTNLFARRGYVHYEQDF